MTKPRSLISRRSFLQTAGTAALLAPFAKFLGPSAAYAQTGTPKRFLVIMSTMGWSSTWHPSGGETDFQLTRCLAPLERHRTRIMPTRGVDMESARNNNITDIHDTGAVHNLTGAAVNGGNRASFATTNSIDQAVADQIGGSSALRSLELSADNVGGDFKFIWRGVGQRVPPESNAQSAFDRAFASVSGGGTTPDPAAVRRRAMRQSILDHQMGALTSAQARLPAADRPRLEEHLTHLRDLESRLGDTGGGGGTAAEACMRPTLGAQDRFMQQVRVKNDIALMALTCGVTNVASVLWSGASGQQTYPELGIETGGHTLSHIPESDAGSHEQLISACNTQAAELAYVLDRLAAVPEGDGTMLDNTLVLWTNELTLAQAHGLTNMPLLLAGNVKGADNQPYFRMGRYMRFDGLQHNNVLTTIAQAFGVNAPVFGDREYCDGPVAALRG